MKRYLLLRISNRIQQKTVDVWNKYDRMNKTWISTVCHKVYWKAKNVEDFSKRTGW